MGMSEAKHTPGEWKTNGAEDSYNEHAVTAGKNDRGEFVYIAFVENDHDRKVIAASKVLLAALQRMADSTCGGVCDWDHDDAIAQAYEAIAKAKGERDA